MPAMRYGFPSFIILCGALSLTGCSWLSIFGGDQQPDAITIVKRLQAGKDSEADTGAAPARIVLPVRVNYSIKSKPAVDSELEVEVEYLALKPLTELKIGYTTSDGLELVATDSPLDFGALKQYETITQRVVVMPKQEAHFNLSLYVVTKAGDADEVGKEIKIPIAVGRYSLNNP